MAITFPSPVADGYSFTAENGVVYTFDSSGGGGWYAYHPDGLNDVYVNIDGDTMTGDLTVPSLNGGPLAGLRNQIINGDFRVWQRGNGPFSTSSALEQYTADRWALGADPARNGSIYKQNAVTNIPAGFSGGVRVTANAPALVQKIELHNNLMAPFAVGQTWTLSVWATVDISSTSPFLTFLQADGASVGSTVAANFVNTGEAASNGYQRYSSTLTVNAEPTTIGTDLACAVLGIRSHRDDGLGVEIRYTGIQLEPGSVATPFEMRPIGTELALCQRYYKNIGTVFLSSSGLSTPTQSCQAMIVFGVPMRAAPSATLTSQNVLASVGTTPTAESIRLNSQASSPTATARVNDLTLDAEL